MTKAKYLRWFAEFIAVTAISLLLAFPDKGLPWIIFPVLLALTTKAWEFSTETNELHMKVYAQLNLIHKFLSLEKDGVRCVFHIPTWNNKLLQTTDYIPEGGGKGRLFSTKKGIIGKAFTQKMAFVANFKDDADYRNSMILDYGYSSDEIKLRTTDRRTYLCIPLLDENHRVLGLVFFDSPKPNLFYSLTDEKTSQISNAVQLIRDSIL